MLHAHAARSVRGCVAAAVSRVRAGRTKLARVEKVACAAAPSLGRPGLGAMYRMCWEACRRRGAGPHGGALTAPPGPLAGGTGGAGGRLGAGAGARPTWRQQTVSFMPDGQVAQSPAFIKAPPARRGPRRRAGRSAAIPRQQPRRGGGRLGTEAETVQLLLCRYVCGTDAWSPNAAGTSGGGCARAHTMVVPTWVGTVWAVSHPPPLPSCMWRAHLRKFVSRQVHTQGRPPAGDLHKRSADAHPRAGAPRQLILQYEKDGAQTSRIKSWAGQCPIQRCFAFS